MVKPFVGVRRDVPSDATVLLVEHGARDGLALAEGINPFYSDLDTYAMMASVIDEAVRRVVSVGAPLDGIAGLDNFCWPDPVESDKTPDGRYKLAQLVRANQALYDLTTAYGVPCISGKDSMKNDSVRGGRKISIPPTVLFSTLARIEDVGRVVSMDFKRPGDAVFAVGLTRAELGASEYHRGLAREQGTPEAFGGAVPAVDADRALATYRAMNEAAARGLLRSSHTPTLGGWAVALALACLGGDLGAEIDLSAFPCDGPLSDDERLFSESNSRFLVTCAPERAGEAAALFARVPCARVGTVTPGPALRVHNAADRLRIDLPLERLRRAFTRTLHGL